MIETVEVQTAKKKEENPDRLRPKIIKWKTAHMVRIHSLRATINEIIQVSKSLDVVHIGIIGNPGSGKSTLAICLAHLIHKMSDVKFTVRIFDKNSLLNFEETLKNLDPANYVLVFDDVSFLGATATKKQIEVIKQAMTEIRHLEGGRDVKIITILNYHYTLGLDKYLRQADFRYFTSVGSSEVDNMEKMVGSKNMMKIITFQKMFTKAIVKKFFTFRISTKETFGYKYREPFIPLLFYNNDSLRYVVSPTREWIDKICSICAFAANGDLKSEISLEKFKEECEHKFNPQRFKSAVKIKLFINGINTWSRPYATALKYLDRALDKKIISLEELAVSYGLTETRTRLTKKLDGELAD